DISVHTRRDDALDGSAARIEADLTLAGPKGTRTASLLAYVPAAASTLRPVPALLGLNFVGNHAMATEPDVCTPASGERIGAAHGHRYNASATTWIRRWAKARDSRLNIARAWSVFEIPI
ncbi:MAG TPA: hypothetical protein VGJ07_23975, partial [Rugosimonospora sp.]